MMMKEKKTIVFLTGFMGSGKSTLGPILANTIGFNFIDLDEIIEQREKKKISEIFAFHGEEAFRTIERQMLRNVITANATVISLGGGSVTNAETLDLIKKSGVLVYLKSDREHIFLRLRTKSDRPMLRDAQGNLLDGEHLMEKIDALLVSRSPFYEQADIIINTDGRNIGFTVDELVKKLSHYIE
jgi:shikimate kinase